jgi:hypothetical protein
MDVRIWFCQFALLRVTNVTICKSDMPHYALRAKLNKMLQYYNFMYVTSLRIHNGPHVHIESHIAIYTSTVLY